MAEPIKISTSKYTKSGKVDIDGNIWEVSLPGAGTELRFSQASRACKLYGARIELLDKKIEQGKAKETDLDDYEEYIAKYEHNEQVLYEIFQNTFLDGTENNESVKKWINDTPTAIITLAFEDVRNKANESEGADGQEESTERS